MLGRYPSSHFIITMIQRAKSQTPKNKSRILEILEIIQKVTFPNLYKGRMYLTNIAL